MSDKLPVIAHVALAAVFSTGCNYLTLFDTVMHACVHYVHTYDSVVSILLGPIPSTFTENFRLDHQNQSNCVVTNVNESIECLSGGV